MAETVKVKKQYTRYYEFMQAVNEIAHRCWMAEEGKFDVRVVNDTGEVRGKIEGGDTWRTKKDEDEG